MQCQLPLYECSRFSIFAHRPLESRDWFRWLIEGGEEFVEVLIIDRCKRALVNDSFGTFNGSPDDERTHRLFDELTGKSDSLDASRFDSCLDTF